MRVWKLLGLAGILAGVATGAAVARDERETDATLRAEDAAVLRPLWDEVVTAVSGALTFRD